MTMASGDERDKADRVRSGTEEVGGPGGPAPGRGLS